MFYTSLVVSLIFLALSLQAVWRSQDLSRTYLWTWAALPFAYGGMCILPAYFFQALLTAMSATVCRQVGAGPQAFTYCALAAFVGSYAAVGVPRAMELWQLAKQYPFESLETRLNYEVGRQAASAPRATSPELTDDDRYIMGLNYSIRAAWHREAALKDLHEGCVQMFVTAQGFGVYRFIGFGPNDLRRADPIISAPPIDLPESPKPDETAGLSSADVVLQPSDRQQELPGGVTAADLRVVHFGTLGNFLDPTGFGYARDRSHVAGFVSHRFTRQPSKPGEKKDEGHWRTESLDLVSLLKHLEPVAYVSKHLPRMDELRDAKTRPLDEFEAEGLTKLRAGEELSFAQGPRRVRMLGAIRARDECLKCHSVDRGGLLGAFSYDLRRDLPLPATKDPP